MISKSISPGESERKNEPKTYAFVDFGLFVVVNRLTIGVLAIELHRLFAMYSAKKIANDKDAYIILVTILFCFFRITIPVRTYDYIFGIWKIGKSFEYSSKS